MINLISTPTDRQLELIEKRNKLIKVYSLVKKVELANNKDVYSVIQEKLEGDFKKELTGFYEGDLNQACEEMGLARTKKEAIEMSGDIIVNGCGKFSGRKIHQLPQSIVNQIAKALTYSVI